MKNVAYSVDPSVQTDLFVCQFGEEACSPSYAFGPHTRDHVLIHFVASGCGVLYCDGQAYPVASGQGFLILPGEETLYQADSVTPWHYAWVGYRGSQAESLTRSAGLSEHHRVFTATDPAKAWNALTLMQEDARSLRLIQMAAAGDLLRFLSLIAPAQGTTAVSPAQAYCEKALWYLEGRYDRNVSIQEAADFVGISRSHLYRLMMDVCGCSPKAKLLQIRMRHARQLLQSTTLTLDDIAHRIGFQTGTQLGTVFRSFHGVSPGVFRSQSVAVHKSSSGGSS